eukprot:Rmarinus@m.21604
MWSFCDDDGWDFFSTESKRGLSTCTLLLINACYVVLCVPFHFARMRNLRCYRPRDYYAYYSYEFDGNWTFVKTKRYIFCSALVGIEVCLCIAGILVTIFLEDSEDCNHSGLRTISLLLMLIFKLFFWVYLLVLMRSEHIRFLRFESTCVQCLVLGMMIVEGVGLEEWSTDVVALMSIGRMGVCSLLAAMLVLFPTPKGPEDMRDSTHSSLLFNKARGSVGHWEDMYTGDDAREVQNFADLKSRWYPSNWFKSRSSIGTSASTRGSAHTARSADPLSRPGTTSTGNAHSSLSDPAVPFGDTLITQSPLQGGRAKSINFGNAFEDDEEEAPYINRTCEEMVVILKNMFESEDGVPLRDHYFRFVLFRNSFVGSEMVDYLVSKASGPECESRREAVSLAQQMMTERYIAHVTDEFGFEDGCVYYKPTDAYHDAAVFSTLPQEYMMPQEVPPEPKENKPNWNTIVNVDVPRWCKWRDPHKNKHIAIYEVCLSVKERRWSVFRRFSQFRALHSSLSTAFPQMPLPPFPYEVKDVALFRTKKRLGRRLSVLSMNDEENKFLDYRKNALAVYLQGVVNTQAFQGRILDEFFSRTGFDEKIEEDEEGEGAESTADVASYAFVDDDGTVTGHVDPIMEEEEECAQLRPDGCGEMDEGGDEISASWSGARVSIPTFTEEEGVTYYNIHVQSSSSEWRIKKRFRQFEGLHGALEKVLAQLDNETSLPPLPDKYHSVPESRRQWLEAFLQQLINVPAFQCDELALFLESDTTEAGALPDLMIKKDKHGQLSLQRVEVHKGDELRRRDKLAAYLRKRTETHVFNAVREPRLDLVFDPTIFSTELAMRVRLIFADTKLSTMTSKSRLQYHFLPTTGLLEVMEMMCDLQLVDPLKFISDAHRKTFFLNVGNVLALIGGIALAAPSKAKLSTASAKRHRIFLGNQEFNQFEIHNHVLRPFSKPDPARAKKLNRLYMNLASWTFDPSDPRSGCAVQEKDRRVHFAVFSTTADSPCFSAYSLFSLDSELDAAVRRYCLEHVRVDMNARKVWLPEIFAFYKDDFGKKHWEVVQYILEFVRDSDLGHDLEALLTSNASFKVSYLPNDDTFRVNLDGERHGANAEGQSQPANASGML